MYKDFEESSSVTKTVSVNADGGDEYGIGEWAIAEWSGGLSLRELNLNLGRTAQYIKLSLESVMRSRFAIQKFNIISKQGRLNL